MLIKDEQLILIKKLKPQSLIDFSVPSLIKFVFAFHFFVLEGSMINKIDSQFVFDNLQECKAADLLIQKFNSHQNCKETITDQVTNNSLDNLRLLIKRYNVSKL